MSLLQFPASFFHAGLGSLSVCLFCRAGMVHRVFVMHVGWVFHHITTSPALLCQFHSPAATHKWWVQGWRPVNSSGVKWYHPKEIVQQYPQGRWWRWVDSACQGPQDLDKKPNTTRVAKLWIRLWETQTKRKEDSKAIARISCGTPFILAPYLVEGTRKCHCPSNWQARSQESKDEPSCCWNLDTFDPNSDDLLKTKP